MPKYYRGILEITLLQKVIEKELDTVDLISKDLLNQFFIYTATNYFFFFVSSSSELYFFFRSSAASVLYFIFLFY